MTTHRSISYSSLAERRAFEILIPKLIKRFAEANRDVAEDHDGATVFLAHNDWQLDRAKKDWSDLRFLQTREQARPKTDAA